MGFWVPFILGYGSQKYHEEHCLRLDMEEMTTRKPVWRFSDFARRELSENARLGMVWEIFFVSLYCIWWAIGKWNTHWLFEFSCLSVGLFNPCPKWISIHIQFCGLKHLSDESSFITLTHLLFVNSTISILLCFLIFNPVNVLTKYPCGPHRLVDPLNI